MKTDEFVCLNRELGHNIISFNGYHWMKKNDGIAISIPSLEIIFPTRSNFMYLFKKGVKIISFKTDLGHYNSFEYVFYGNEYYIEHFDSKTRNQIRKSLKSCVFSRPQLSDLVDTGFEINVATLTRQGRFIDYLGIKDLWTQYITNLYNARDVFILGAYYDKLLISYSLFIKINEVYCIYHPFINLEYSSYCPMNGILFTFINETIKSEGQIKISYGLASYIDKPGLDKFKKAMMFVEEPITRISVINPLFSLFINKITKAAIELVVILRIKDESLIKKFEYLLESKHWLKEYYEYIKKEHSL